MGAIPAARLYHTQYRELPPPTPPGTYHQTIYESDISKGLEIMRCSKKVPKSVTHDGTRGRTESSCSSRYIYIYSYMGHTLVTGTGQFTQCQFTQMYEHLALSFPAEPSLSISKGMLIIP